MSYSRGKKTAILVSKKKNGALSSSGPTAKIHHPFLQFPIWPQEELLQILRARPLIAGRCIDWAVVEQEFKEENDLDILNRHIHHSLSGAGRRESTSVVNTHDAYFYGVCCTGTSLTLLISLPSPFNTRWCGIGRGSSPLAPMLLGWLILWAPQHRGPGIILDPHWPDVSTRHLEHAKHEDDRKAPRYRLAQSTKEEAPEDITDDVPPQHEDTPSQPPPPSPDLSAPPHLIATPPHKPSSDEDDLWTNEPLPPTEYPPPPSRRLFSKTPKQPLGGGKSIEVGG
ncbi:hypothetical protein GOBAR_AA35116 [Gossypium barbadense]|uniref:Uncharacterized protein n=1 Tax=Gossypium barbadense TaxID=3634 RepID=A0A2P5W3A8_GOSBA|nr:hypothetical protein GOBAR_AA35116 [Gossypium barbadense]